MAGQPMAGKTCLVTGATSGIGKETARGLAALGATVVLASRDAARGEETRADLVATTGNARVEVMRVDLARLDDVRRFAREVEARHPRLDVLVNNAGFYTSRRALTPDGFESTFAVCHLAHFLLTNLLLDALRRAAPSRVVTVASEAHQRGRLRFDDLMGAKRYRGFDAYAQAKLANVMFAYELARRLEGSGVVSNVVHPGVVRTRIWDRDSAFVRIGARLVSRFMLTPAEGAAMPLRVATAPELADVSGAYFSKGRLAESSARSRDAAAARRLWDESARLVKLA